MGHIRPRFRVTSPRVRPAFGERSDRIVRCDPGEGESPQSLPSNLEREALTPTLQERASLVSTRKSGAREIDTAVALYFDAFSSREPDPTSLENALLLRDRPVGNIPVLAVEDRNVERLHRRVVVGGIAVGDAVEEIRRMEAGEVSSLS